MTIPVKMISIDGGIIAADNFGNADSINDFLAELDRPPISIEKVVGWNFARVYLMDGNMENGTGWAFVTRGGPRPNSGPKPKDGKRGSRYQVILDDTSVERLRAIGNGQLSAGIRKAAELVKIAETEA